MTRWGEASAIPRGRDAAKMVLHKGGHRAEGPNADDRVRTDLDECGLGPEHPGGNHEGDTGGIADGHGLVSVARAKDS